MRNHGRLLLLACSAALASFPAFAHRPPSVPLITHNPYFSIWSNDDKLTDGTTRHWTGSRQPLTSVVRVDGKPFRIMGDSPRETPAMEQVSVKVEATHTRYVFRGAGIEVELSFFTPAFLQDMDLLSRPVTYLTWTAKSTDGAEHAVDVLLDVSPMLAVNEETDSVTWGRSETGALNVLNTGSRDQRMLDKRGDNLRIDWGYFHLAVPKSAHAETRQVDGGLDEFVKDGSLPAADALDMPEAVRDGAAHSDTVLHLGSVGSTPASQHVLVSYTEGFAVEYLNQRLRPYWQRDNKPVATMLDEAEQQYSALETRGTKYDDTLEADLNKAGGEDYAYLSLLAYREGIAAHQLTADADGKPLLFSKENFSNGCIGTVDVLYPSAPLFLFFNPALLHAQLEPVMRYSAMPRWKFPFAPHDLGTWPLANGQVYGGGELTEDDQMPVEESGNMLILADALAHAEGSPTLAQQYWPQFTKWAKYLLEKGLDPENQLSTDDFAGHLAHNANLSIKAIEAIAAYGDLAERLGKPAVAKEYRTAAKEMAAKWMTMAADGDHTKLAFDKPGSWSQKYNLVWDQLLGLKLFPPSLRESELKFYLAHENKYGVPLDVRRDYTKLDWEMWTATMASSQDDFKKFIAPMAVWADETTSRVPMTDWYDTKTGEKSGFQARSVVGGLFIKALSDETLAKKWQAMDTK